MKSIKVTFSNGEVWQVPASVVFKHIAQYAFEHDWYDGLTTIEEVYTEVEAQYSIFTYDLIDWLINNMNLSDIAGVAQKVDQVAFDYEYAWLNLEDDDFEVVE